MKTILDFSHLNPNVDWDQLAQMTGLEGVVLKVSEGITVQDSVFQVRFRAANSHLVAVKGLYHFYHPADDPNSQANNYIRQRDTAEAPKTIPAIVDLEDCENLQEWPNVPEEQRYSDLKTFIARLEAEGYPIMIYSSHNFMSRILPHADFLLSYLLWVAWYEAAPPLLPSPWTAWTWWQYTGSGNVAGVQGDCDISYVQEPLSASA
jgi:lysozyme